MVFVKSFILDAAGCLTIYNRINHEYFRSMNRLFNQSKYHLEIIKTAHLTFYLNWFRGLLIPLVKRTVFCSQLYVILRSFPSCCPRRNHSLQIFLMCFRSAPVTEISDNSRRLSHVIIRGSWKWLRRWTDLKLGITFASDDWRFKWPKKAYSILILHRSLC